MMIAGVMEEQICSMMMGGLLQSMLTLLYCI